MPSTPSSPYFSYLFSVLFACRVARAICRHVDRPAPRPGTREVISDKSPRRVISSTVRAWYSVRHAVVRYCVPLAGEGRAGCWGPCSSGWMRAARKRDLANIKGPACRLKGEWAIQARDNATGLHSLIPWAGMRGRRDRPDKRRPLRPRTKHTAQASTPLQCGYF